MSKEKEPPKIALPPAASPAERKKKIERYNRMMQDVADEQLLEARSKLVRLYRANPQTFPNGPDARAWGGDPWYVPEQWSDEGSFLGTKPNPRPRPRGYQPKPEPPLPPIKSATETPVTAVTESPVTENQTVTENASVTKKGRPPKPAALSTAERARLYRQRLRDTTKK